MDLRISQENRLLKLEFDGKVSNAFVPVAVAGEEALSQLYAFTVDIVSDDLSLAPDKVLGHRVAVLVTLGAIARRFEGIVARFSPGLLWGRGYRSYQLEVVPRLWLATLNARCRSFLNKSALDIVHEVLGEYGISESKRGPGAVTRPVREYCLQYCESDFAFLSRLLEEEGLFFYFPLDHGDRQLVLVDGLNGAFEVDGEAVRLGPHGSLSAWSHDVRTVPQGVTYWGYDFKEASVVAGSVPGATRLAYAADAKVEAYPSNILDTPRSQFLADMHMQRLESDYASFGGAGAHPRFAPGGQFKLGDGEPIAAGKNFMLTAVRHHATCYSHVSSEGEAPSYGCDFACVPIDAKYRPPRRTRRPLIHGPQTATVSSDPDEHGRVKVKFHWGNQLESWWIRVAMPWAHSQMGFQFLPRQGSEVVVQFLDGDPERPIIVGAVYNGVNKPIYTPLPDHKTTSGIRGTDPARTGAAETLNELQFEDKPGAELIAFFAPRDFTRTVVKDDSVTVREGDRAVRVRMGNLATTVDQGNETTEIKMGNVELKLGMGNHSVKLDLGASTTEAMQSIELKVGANSVKLDQTGITLSGLMIKIEGTVMTSVKGPMTTVEGEGLLTVKGGLTMIN